MNIDNKSVKTGQQAWLGNRETLSFDEAAKYLGKSKSWLYKHIKHIEHFKPTGKLIFVDRSSLDSFLRSNRVAPQNELQDRAMKAVSKM